MSDYYGDATLEDWLAEEVFRISDAPIPPDVVALFEQWREGVEGQIRSWMDTDDGEGNRLSWRGWGRGFNGIPDSEQAAFEAAVVKGKTFLAGTWTAAIMPDDALPPDSLVGRMLNADKPKGGPPEFLLVYQCLPGETEITGPEVRAIPPEPLPLWRVMEQARCRMPLGVEYPHEIAAAEIDALRDYIVPEEPEPEPFNAQTMLYGKSREAYLRWHERQLLRAQLTEQARIARGDA